MVVELRKTSIKGYFCAQLFSEIVSEMIITLCV